MKSLILCATFALAASTGVHAQYFQHQYGYSPDIGTTPLSGMVTSATGPGHLVAGNHSRNLGGIPLTGDFGIYVLRTDAGGRFTGPGNFNNSYLFMASSGMELRFTNGAAAVEYPDGSGYAVVATYFHETLQQNQGIAFVKLDNNGNVVFVRAYKMPNSTAAVGLSTSSLKPSTSQPGHFFATGQYFNDLSNYLWAIRFDQSGNLFWGGLYDIATVPERPGDLVESPYRSELLIVGAYPSAGTEKAFMLVLNSANGAVITANQMSAGAIATWESLRSIDVSNDPVSPGFILSGISDSKPWVSKLGTTRNFMWSHRYQPVGLPLQYMYAYDVVGRLNTANQYEYYVTGPVNEDAYIMKLNSTGVPVSNGLFMYDIGVEETGLDVDVKNGGADAGVTMYAVAEDDPLRQAYIVKAYFNGRSGCNENFISCSRQSLQCNPVATFGVGTAALLTEGITLKAIQTNLDAELCYNTTIPGGSNARPELPASPNALFTPNPVKIQAGGTLQVIADIAAEAQVTICDMMGRAYYSNKFNLKAGKNELHVALSNSGMAAGLYIVKVNSGNLNTSIMLLVK